MLRTPQLSVPILIPYPSGRHCHSFRHPLGSLSMMLAHFLLAFSGWWQPYLKPSTRSWWACFVTRRFPVLACENFVRGQLVADMYQGNGLTIMLSLLSPVLWAWPIVRREETYLWVKIIWVSDMAQRQGLKHEGWEVGGWSLWRGKMTSWEAKMGK